MIRGLLFISTLIAFFNVCSQESPYLKEESYNYSELLEVYKKLEETSSFAKLIEVGKSDIGKPIYLFVINKAEVFEPTSFLEREKTVVFINNGIHAGESCGVDASVELVKKLLNPKSDLHHILDSTIVCIIPAYNVGGMLNRGAYSRANQLGPKEHGFRGNAKNLDLNRDFIKLDSRNAKTFTRIFRDWDPDIFVDTHTTNGSDHQYTLTLIATQKDKLNPTLSSYAEKKMIPALYSGMSEKYMDMIPYVYNYKKSPEEGIKDFLETPRYSSGYTSLFDCFSFITEAHVYKPFSQRVKHTMGFLVTLVEFAWKNNATIRETRKSAKQSTLNQNVFPIEWELDTSNFRKINFNGYSAVNRKSELTGNTMMFYNRDKPFSEKINYFNSFKVKNKVGKPKFYVIPQAYEQVLERLKLNKVEFQQLEKDTLIELSAYYLTDYNTSEVAYEGHYLHSKINVNKKLEKIQFYKGDYLIQVNQLANRYIVETLEPHSVDGFFAWNFFDAILQQKEWFSDYAFEPKALELLENDSELKTSFEKKRREDEKFASNSWAQLYYIYKRSPYYEKTVNRYPIYRIEND